MMSKRQKQLFNKGAKGASTRTKSSGKFLSVKDGDKIQFAPLVDPMTDMISTDVHEFWEVNPFISFPCLGQAGEDCPGCECDNNAKFKAYLPVVLKDKSVKIFAFGLMVFRELEMLDDSLGSLKGKLLQVVRRGKGFETKYKVISLGKDVDVSAIKAIDVVEEIGDTEYDVIAGKLASAGLMSYSAAADDDEDFEEDADEEEAPFDVDADDDEEDWDF